MSSSALQANVNLVLSSSCNKFSRNFLANFRNKFTKTSLFEIPRLVELIIFLLQPIYVVKGFLCISFLLALRLGSAGCLSCLKLQSRRNAYRGAFKLYYVATCG